MISSFLVGGYSNVEDSILVLPLIKAKLCVAGVENRNII